jgi:glycosyltransferase involved in cell wall biosynthesis
MRVAFFGDTSHPNAVGWIRDLVEMFGIEIHAVDYEQPSLGVAGVRQHRLRVSAPRKTRFLVSGRPLHRMLKAIEPDLLLGYRVVSYGFAAARAAFRPLVLAGQGQRIVSVESPPGARWTARYALRRADLCLAWADHMAEAMRALGADPSRIRVLNRGVRSDVFRPAADGRRAPIVITARQLASYYRTDLVIEGFSRARSHVGSGELWIAGEGPERTRLEAMARDCGVASHVRFLGRLSMEELASAYREASVYASMVPTDGVSSSLLEAMSSGLIPIVVDNEANRPWVRGTTDGRLVAAGDAAGLATALTPILAGELPSSDIRSVNRERVVAHADRRTNLSTMLGWWNDLVQERT